MRILLPSDWSQEGKLARVGCPWAGFLLLGLTRIVLGPCNHCQVYGFHKVQDGVRTTCFKHVLAGFAASVTLVTGSWDFPSFSQRDPVSELLAAPHSWYPSSGVWQGPWWRLMRKGSSLPAAQEDSLRVTTIPPAVGPQWLGVKARGDEWMGAQLWWARVNRGCLFVPWKITRFSLLWKSVSFWALPALQHSWFTCVLGCKGQMGCCSLGHSSGYTFLGFHLALSCWTSVWVVMLAHPLAWSKWMQPPPLNSWKRDPHEPPWALDQKRRKLGGTISWDKEGLLGFLSV